VEDEELERIAARMRKVGERTDLLIYERLRIAVRQAEPRTSSAPSFAGRGFMLASRRRRRELRTAASIPAEVAPADEIPPPPSYIIVEGAGQMANGWAPDGAVHDQIEDSIKDGVMRSRAGLPSGEGLRECEDCGEDIPAARRRALPGARTCVACQSVRDKRPVFFGINRRGSKDSQLR
jgi:phage/conjugal plasmid C-4 type zinc finger TraR family protein